MRRQATPEQKAAAQERRDRIRAMLKRINAMQPGEQEALIMQRGAISTVEGHQLSRVNTLLLLFQGCSSPVVGGFQQWRLKGRQVMKGVHGYAIWIPLGAKPEGQEDEETEVTFKLATVFGLNQTEETDKGEVAA